MALFHAVQETRAEDGRADLSDLPPERPGGPQDGDLPDAKRISPLAPGWTGRVFRPVAVAAAGMRRRICE